MHRKKKIEKENLLEVLAQTLDVVEEKKTKKTRKVKEGVNAEAPKRKLNKKEREILELAGKTVLPDHYKTVWTLKDLTELTEWLEKEPIIAIDTETLGVNVFMDDIVGISFYAPHKGWYIPLRHLDDIFDKEVHTILTPPESISKPMKVGIEYVKCLPKHLVSEALKPILENKDKKWLLHNAK